LEKLNFKSSNKNMFCKFVIKSYLVIAFSLIAIFILNITDSETFTLFENGIKLTYLKRKMVNKFNLYINSCVNNILIDKKKYPLLKRPKISAIIPIYNGGKYLHYSLRSIQNQKMKDIEILLIDDCSTDNTFRKIEKYMKEDERIRFIQNIENRKILYSKSIAALNSKGKYIIQLDQDDIFIRDDVFDILYNEAEKEDLDLVQIRDICQHNYIFKKFTRVNSRNIHFIFPKKTHYKKQPELKDKMFFDKNNYLLWGLLIKSDIYKKALYHLWPLIINYKIIYFEDYTVTFIIIILSKKYKYLNHFGLIHLFHSNSTSYNRFKDSNYSLSALFFGNTLFDYHINKNPRDIQIFIHYFQYFQRLFNQGGKSFPKLYKFLIKKVINNEYLSYEQKEFFKKKINLNKGISEYVDSFDYENIYNYQMSMFNKKKNYIINISDVKISIIIFCTEYKYLDKTINSIQKQLFSHYEIILIYDSNEHNGINIIKKYSKENPNINLINNKNKKGLIYSISIGVLSSIGKYILILEPSNTLAKQNILNELYNIISNGHIDILEFNLLINYQKTINKNGLILYKCNHFKSELNLKTIKYNKNYISIDQQKDLLINKLVKADLFKNIIKKFKLNEYQRVVYNYYDNIFLYAFQKSNIKFKRTNLFGVIKNIKNTKALNINNIIEDKKQKIKDSLFYINFILENSYNSFEEKKFVLNEFFNIMSIIYNKFNRINTESYTLFEKIMKCPYITKKDKYYVNFFYNSLIN
jgi:glycosyltransferase involved in cell wall biosynthesis